MLLSGGYKPCSFHPGCNSQRERGQSGGAGSAGAAELGSLAWSACGGQSGDLGYAQGAAIISYTLQNCVGIFFLPLSCIMSRYLIMIFFFVFVIHL